MRASWLVIFSLYFGFATRKRQVFIWSFSPNGRGLFGSGSASGLLPGFLNWSRAGVELTLACLCRGNHVVPGKWDVPVLMLHSGPLAMRTFITEGRQEPFHAWHVLRPFSSSSEVATFGGGACWIRFHWPNYSLSSLHSANGKKKQPLDV